MPGAGNGSLFLIGEKMIAMLRRIKEDIQIAFKKDPAARSVFEVMLCYPGLHAIWIYRIAHFFWNHNLLLSGRLVSHFGRWLTGIEIHPGAKIGRGFFIDHGMGIVIGETSEIGDDVLIYQGVVLGGTSLKREKRHPTLGDNVTVGAGAIVLGAITIGNGARIGAGSVVIHDVPAGATVVGVPGRVGMGFSAPEIRALEHGKLPDPIADAIRYVVKRQEKIEQRLQKVESLEGITADIDNYLDKKKKEIIAEFRLSSERFDNGGGI